jgi:4-amino-4-deoxy-L-arabinose transferase-like glycosyltransferase
MANGSATGKREQRYYYVLLLLISILALFLRFKGISEQPPLADEFMTAFTADNYMERGQFGPVMPFHPNLRNILVYASMKLFGTGAYGMRILSLALGSLSIPLLAVLVLRLTGNRVAAGLAAFLLAVDPVHITFSRQAIQEVHTMFFFLLGIQSFVMWFQALESGKRLWLLPLAGLLFGLGLASKSHALFPLMVCFVLAVFVTLARKSWSALALSVASLIVLPFSVYLLTYIPWFERGYDLGEWLFMQRALSELMVAHQGTAAATLQDSEAWLWFIKPLMGYGNFTNVGDEVFVTIAVGNPLVWMLVIPASVHLFVRGSGGKGLLMLQALFWVSYLPLALSPRPLWLLSSVAVTPFAYGLVGESVSRLTRRRFAYLGAYAVAVLAVSLYLYPLAVAKGWQYEYLRWLVEMFNPHEQ